MRDSDYYAILGVGVDAEVEVILRAYSLVIGKLRQDKAGVRRSVALTRRIERARAVLLNPAARAAYDARCVGHDLIEETVSAIRSQWRSCESQMPR